VKVEEYLIASTIDRIHAQSANEGHRLLPTVFTIEKGQPIPYKSPGPGSLYVIEGELILEDFDNPENPIHLHAGDVSISDPGTFGKISTPSKGRAFGVSYLPAPLVLTDLRTK